MIRTGRKVNGYEVDYLKEIGSSQERPVTETLYVSPNGNNTIGINWETAFTTLQGALARASTNANELTLINLGPGTYDINTTGDPTYTGNYIIKGAHRNWSTIKNDHASATSVLKFTGKADLSDLTINCGSGSNDGIIMTGAGSKSARLRHVYLECENVTGAQTAIEISDSEYARLDDVKVHGVVTHTLGLLIDDCKLSNFERIDIHECLAGIQFTGTSPDNLLSFLLFHECTLGLDIDSGDNQFFHEVAFSECTTNVDDEVGNHSWVKIRGAFPATQLPDDFTGVDLDTDGAANTWGANTEILSAASRTKPFRVLGIDVEADANEKFRVRLSADGGTTHFIDVQIEGNVAAVQRQGLNLPAGTEEIFNYNTQISGSSKSESGGDTATVWLEVQEI